MITRRYLLCTREHSSRYHEANKSAHIVHSYFSHAYIFKRKSIPYLECFSTKTPWWTTLQPPYTLVHRTDELLGLLPDGKHGRGFLARR